MLRQIVLLSAFAHAVVFGELEQEIVSENTLERRLARRRSEDEAIPEGHREAVVAIAIYAGFRFKNCARALDAWDSPMEKTFIRMFAGMIQGVFINLEARRRMGFNVDHFLNNIAAHMSTTCEDGREVMVAECNQRAQFRMNLNLGKSLSKFMDNFEMLSDGTDGLMTCALAEIPQICDDYYTELCVADE